MTSELKPCAIQELIDNAIVELGNKSDSPSIRVMSYSQYQKEKLQAENARLKELLRWCWGQLVSVYTVCKSEEAFELKKVEVADCPEKQEIEKLVGEK